MIKHAFMKNMTDTVRKSYEKAFQKLEPVSIMRPSKFELPLTSIRRILGDKFYTMKDTSDDVLSLTIYDEGIYSVEDLKSSTERGTEFTNFFCSVFYDGFIEAAGHKIPLSKDFCDKKIAKLCITSESKGLETVEVSLNDISALCDFDANGNAVGIKYGNEFTEIAAEINKSQEAYSKLQQTGNEIALKSLEMSMQEYSKRSLELQNKLFDGIIECILDKTEVKDFSEIHDITFLFGIEVADETNVENVFRKSTVISYHDCCSKDVMMLENIFKVSKIVEQQNELK